MAVEEEVAVVDESSSDPTATRGGWSGSRRGGAGPGLRGCGPRVDGYISFYILQERIFFAILEAAAPYYDCPLPGDCSSTARHTHRSQHAATLREPSRERSWSCAPPPALAWSRESTGPDQQSLRFLLSCASHEGSGTIGQLPHRAEDQPFDPTDHALFLRVLARREQPLQPGQLP